MQLVIRERRHGEIVILDLTGKIVIGEGSRLLSEVKAELLAAAVHDVTDVSGTVPHGAQDRPARQGDAEHGDEQGGPDADDDPGAAEREPAEAVEEGGHGYS